MQINPCSRKFCQQQIFLFKNNKSSSEVKSKKTNNGDALNGFLYKSVDLVSPVNFKANPIQVVEPMKFSTKVLFSSLRDELAIKSKAIEEISCKYRELLLKDYPNCEISLPAPIVGISSEILGDILTLIRVPNKDTADYFMLVKSSNKEDKIEIKDDKLVADFSLQDKGISLNEYVSMGLQSQLEEIKLQKKFVEMEADYSERESEIFQALSGIHQQLESFNTKIQNNSKDIEDLQSYTQNLQKNIEALKNKVFPLYPPRYKHKLISWQDEVIAERFRTMLRRQETFEAIFQKRIENT